MRKEREREREIDMSTCIKKKREKKTGKKRRRRIKKYIYKDNMKDRDPRTFVLYKKILKIR